MDDARKLSFLVFLLCVLISLKDQNVETNGGSPTSSWSSSSSDDDHMTSILTYRSPSWRELRAVLMNRKLEESDNNQTLEYDYYRQSCPQAEQIIRSTVRDRYKVEPNLAPALLRLVFHDCFVKGCDASVLLDSENGISSEKDSPPNQSLKGFDVIDLIKSKLEEACPVVVSCADIVVLAARESVLLAGGPFYPLSTGRRDSTVSFSEIAMYELPNPQDNLSKITASFASKGFDERETVSLLGAHSTGTIHCKFFLDRLYNFRGTTDPDPSMDSEFVNQLRSTCNKSDNHESLSPSSLSPFGSPSSPSPQGPGMKMDYEGPGTGFGTLYFRSLLQAKGILFVDQQLTAGEKTETWVRAYASDVSLFRRDFATAMMKLSGLQALTAPKGQIRQNCRKVA